MTDNTDKIKSIGEAIELLKVRVSDFQRKLDDEKAEEFLRRCKQRGLISTFVGDKDYKPESS
jgi:predicted phage tail protein